jgi:hypothetical protein
MRFWDREAFLQQSLQMQQLHVRRNIRFVARRGWQHAKWTAHFTVRLQSALVSRIWGPCIDRDQMDPGPAALRAQIPLPKPPASQTSASPKRKTRVSKTEHKIEFLCR